MSNLMDAVVVSITWHAVGPNPCHKCLSLNSNIWTNIDIFQDYLIDPAYGAIYDFNLDKPLVHPHDMCHVEVSEIDVDLESLEIG